MYFLGPAIGFSINVAQNLNGQICMKNLEFFPAENGTKLIERNVKDFDFHFNE